MADNDEGNTHRGRGVRLFLPGSFDSATAQLLLLELATYNVAYYVLLSPLKDPEPHGRREGGGGQSLEAGGEEASECLCTRRRACQSAVGRGGVRGGVGWCKAAHALSLQCARQSREVGDGTGVAVVWHGRRCARLSHDDGWRALATDVRGERWWHRRGGTGCRVR